MPVSSLVCRGPWARQGLQSREELGNEIPVFIHLSIPSCGSFILLYCSFEHLSRTGGERRQATFLTLTP